MMMDGMMMNSMGMGLIGVLFMLVLLLLAAAAIKYLFFESRKDDQPRAANGAAGHTPSHAESTPGKGV